jgi:nitroimidazol reductase NimA-like FMN-containing flavoprotein (pyridoxamine 5'-phosphate oxidase superfamily)
MNADAPTLRTLPAGECLRRLKSVPVGRIAYTKNALPAVEPVKFALDGRHIIIRIDPGSALSTALHHTVVAFEADNMDLENHRGWSVTIVGNAREVIEPSEIARLRALGLESWAAADDDYFVQILPGIVTGQELRAAAN